MLDQEEDEKQAPLSGIEADPVMSHFDEKIFNSLKKILIDQRCEEIVKFFPNSFLDHI